MFISVGSPLHCPLQQVWICPIFCSQSNNESSRDVQLLIVQLPSLKMRRRKHKVRGFVFLYHEQHVHHPTYLFYCLPITSFKSQSLSPLVLPPNSFCLSSFFFSSLSVWFPFGITYQPMLPCHPLHISNPDWDSYLFYMGLDTRGGALEAKPPSSPPPNFQALYYTVTLFRGMTMIFNLTGCQQSKA